MSNEVLPNGRLPISSGFCSSSDRRRRSRCRGLLRVKTGQVVGRYYDPQSGQFISVDPLVDLTGQAYSYTGGNPVNAPDPTGLSGGGTVDISPGYCNKSPSPCGGVSFNGTVATLKTAVHAVASAGIWVYHNPGSVLEFTAAGVCIVASTGACAAVVLGAVAGELYQQARSSDLNATNVGRTILLGATDLLSAGIGGLVESIAAKASVGFDETAIYGGIKYGLRVLSVTPSVIIQVSRLSSNSAQVASAAASTAQPPCL